MKRDYIKERSGHDDDYDDIYPSILKQQPSHFKSLMLGLCLRFMHLWHNVLMQFTFMRNRSKQWFDSKFY